MIHRDPTKEEAVVDTNAVHRIAFAAAFQSSAFVSVAPIIKGTTLKDADSFGPHVITAGPAKAGD